MYIPYSIEKVWDSPYPDNVGIPRQNGNMFRQYPRGRVYLSSLVISMNMTLLISNKNTKSYSLFSRFLYFLLLFFFILALFIIRYQHDAPTNWGLVGTFLSKDNVLHVLIQTLPNPFFIHNFILHCYFCHTNDFTLSIFIFVLLLFFYNDNYYYDDDYYYFFIC